MSNEFISDNEFAQLVKDMLEYLTPGQLADDLLVSVPTIKRWAEGKNIPAPLARKAVATSMKHHKVWDFESQTPF